ncbi:MAG: phosphoenolpyruvate--protein phosphotransferase [Eubacteriales bacterium]|nr:phosphoenolpyruvate--protein phosphotransferase [Eubacteriales bacterium]
MLRGIGTSKGIGMGNALVLVEQNVRIKTETVENAEEEILRYRKAKQQFVHDTDKLIEGLAKQLKEQEKTALVLKNQVYLVKDIELNEGIENLIKTQKICAEAAVEDTCNLYINIFSNMENAAMNQRVIDIVDMKNRLIRILMGVNEVDFKDIKPGTIIVARELHPSMTALMDTSHIAGIVAEKGGDTSHAAILARALEIPAVLSVRDVCAKIKNGEQVIVDGEYGEVFVNPIEKTIEIYRRKQSAFLEKREELKKYIDKNTETADGKKVLLAANIGNEQEAAKAVADGAEGIGLFRTEFLFMNGVSMPSEDEQYEAYRRVAVIFKDKPVIIRTLDIGGDKDIPYMGLSREANPFLGYRGIRFCLDRVDVFTVQLRAILRASAYGHIKIMIPMVTALQEILAVKKIIHGICQDFDRKEISYDKNIKLGIMIETPAAAAMADVLAHEADFFSIGTNDLTQYMMAVDRTNENVSYLYSTFNPAVLRMIKRIISCGHEAGIEVGMCGEAAGNPSMIPLLLAFGLDEFSVTASKVLDTRKNIADWTCSEAEGVAKQVMELYTDKEISNYLGDYILNKK